MSGNSSIHRRVGYWWSEKKSRKFNVNLFTQICRNAGLELIKIDLEKTFEEQGPFTAIVHKLSDIIVKAHMGDAQSQAICQGLQDYVSNHPEVVVIDPLPNMEKLLDRFQQFTLIENSLQYMKGVAFVPAFVEMTTKDLSENLTKMEAGGVTFPFVCKPSLAHASTLAHQMCIIFNKEGLNDITVPCVAQKFVNHNAVLYKLFVVGEKYFVVERPSLKNFTAGDQKTIFFNSHNVSKPNSSSVLNELDESEPKTPTLRPEKEKLDEIVHILSRSIGLTLCGIDIAIDNSTGQYAIVDMNLFPGYDEVDNFFQLLCDEILRQIESHTNPLGAGDSSSAHSMCSPCQEFTINAGKELCTDVIPYTCQCFCCPITGICDNAVHEPLANPQSVALVSETLQTLNAAEQPLKEKAEAFGLPDNTQDDSGIETSDSCDEKKKATFSKAVKRQHSRNYSVALEETA